jgi:murein DD-endopeptidase MepM/ murein hydrolase activator NlpD
VTKVRLVAAAGLATSMLVGSGRAAPSGTAGPSSSSTLAMAALDRKMADLDSEEQSDKQELGRLSSHVAEARVRLVEHGRAYYRLTRAGLLPLGGGFDALVRYALHVERTRRMVAADVDEGDRLRTRVAEITDDLERVARDRTALASQRTAMDAARIAVEDEARRQAAFDKAFETSTGAGGGFVPVYAGAAGVVPDGLPGGFAAARGRLLFPVVGRADVRPAHREGTDGPGLEIHAPVGSVVRAAFAGRVAFADRYGPYGRIVILDHGDHYYTVSGDLDEVDVKIGESIGAGQRIGTVGDDGQGAMLYFEVRHGSQTIAPMAWLGL